MQTGRYEQGEQDIKKFSGKCSTEDDKKYSKILKGMLLIRKGDYDEAFEILSNIDIESGDVLTNSWLVSELCQLYEIKGRYDDAIKKILGFIKFHEKILGEKETINLTKLKLIIANIYMNQGKYDESLEIFKISLNVFKENNDMINYSSTLMNIGVYYYYKNDFKTAKEYFLNSLEIKKRISHKPGIHEILYNVSAIEISIGNHNNAIQYIDQMLDICVEMGNINGIAETYFLKGICEKENQQYKKALKYLHKSLEFNKKLDNPHLYLDNYSNLGHLYFKLAEYEKCEKYYKMSYDLAKKIHNAPYLVNICSFIVKYYLMIGKYDLSKKYIDEFTRLAQGNKQKEIYAEIYKMIYDLNSTDQNSEKIKIIKTLKEIFNAFSDEKDKEILKLIDQEIKKSCR